MEWTRKRFRFPNEKDDGRKVLPKHIWLGVSVENEDYTFRIMNLQKVTSRVRFLSIEPLSIEPLLGSVKLSSKLLCGIHWVI